MYQLLTVNPITVAKPVIRESEPTIGSPRAKNSQRYSTYRVVSGKSERGYRKAGKAKQKKVKMFFQHVVVLSLFEARLD